MSFDRLSSTGKGKLAWRVSVEGWPYDFVSHIGMVLPIQKDGLQGWSASDYLSASSTMAGSDTMTRSILFRLDATTSAAQCFGRFDSASDDGWVLGISSDAAAAIIGDGTTQHNIVSASLSIGTTYVWTISFDGTDLRAVLGQTSSTATSVGASISTAAVDAVVGKDQQGSDHATNVTILGVAATDAVALTEAQMQTHNARVSAQGQMLNLLDGEHLYRAPDLDADLIGSTDWTINGRPTVTTVDAVAGTYGRKRLLGLKSDGFEFKERVDPVTAEWDPSGFDVIIAGGGKRHGNKAAQAFQGPSSRTWLGSNLTSSANTIAVKSTADFSTSGVIHIDTEAIYYTGTTSTTFTGCVRGIWGTVAQAHYFDDDTEDSRAPLVTDVPQVLEGRRVKVYAYGSGDDKQGDGGNSGNPVWFGVASTGPRFDGLNWTFMVDGPSRLLEDELGADLGDGLPLRGIYYSEADPLVINIYEGTNSIVPNIAGTSGASAKLAMTGFWGSQADFIADLTTNLQTVVTSYASGSFSTAAQGIHAVADGDSWAVEWKTASTGELGLLVKGVDADNRRISFADGRFSRYPYDASDHTRTAIGVVSADTTYRFQLIGGTFGLDRPGSVPRGSIGISTHRSLALHTYLIGEVIKKDSATWSNGRIYLAPTSPITGTITQATLNWNANGNGVTASDSPRGAVWDVDSVDTTNNYFQLDAVRANTTGDFLVATAANVPTIKFGLKYTTGTLANFLDAITDLWPTNINKGIVPDFRNADVDLTGDSLTAITSAANSTNYTMRRRFVYSTRVSFKDIIEQECRLLGVHPAMGTDGTIIFKRLRVPSPSEASDASIVSTDAITGSDGFLSYEHGQYAFWTTVRYETKYDGVEDKHKGDTVIVRDVDAFGASRRSRVLDVSPLSEDPAGPIDHAELRKLAGRVLGTFGGNYSILTITVPMSKWGIGIGDIVAVTWTKVPDEVGGLGVTGKLGYVLSREWSPMKNRGVLEILLVNQRVGGYVPSALVASQSGSGTAWDVTITATNYLPSGLSAEDIWEAGWEIQVSKWDNTSAGTVTGSVDSVTGNVLSITFDATWTPSTDTWFLTTPASTSISAANQKVYVYVAETDGLVHWASSDTDDAFTMS